MYAINVVNNFIPLHRLGQSDTSIAGGKAAALGELMRACLPVPNGFVISSQAARAQHPQPSPVFVQQLMTTFDLLGTPLVAVRSSAANEDGQDASWAGQLNTFLDVSREALLRRVQDCWESAHSERALAYAKQHGAIAGPVAVIVQAMIPSTASGVAFSVHPVTKNAEHIIIEAGLGLGEAVVSGQVTPDTYIVHKKSLSILERHVATQLKQLVGGQDGPIWQSLDESVGTGQKLADQHIANLARHVQAIENHFGYPVDVEWALADGKLYITQARPITTLML